MVDVIKGWSNVYGKVTEMWFYVYKLAAINSYELTRKKPAVVVLI